MTTRTLAFLSPIITLLTYALLSYVASAAEPLTIRLWEQAAPGGIGSEEKDIPTAIVYRPEQTSATTGAIVILPGGGYGHPC